MAYCLHIEREDRAPIALAEWQAAVAKTEGVRIFALAAHTGINPQTGEVLRMRANEGDTDVFFPDENEWQSIFRWHGDSAIFAARFETTETSHPIWKASVALATLLGARIRGDEGEIYDFATGNISRAPA
jgi:hypothetical protein